MSVSKLAVIALAIAYAEARFGQEGLVQAEISALGDLGDPGVAATLAGESPGVLLAGSGPCDKLSLADEMVSELGTSDAVLSAAASLVAAERNFNPSAVETGDLCADPSLPATEALRGIVPLFDPDVEGADVQNANSAASLSAPFDAQGMSVAEVALAQGFSNFVAIDGSGAEVALAGLGAGGGASAGNGSGNGNANENANGNANENANGNANGNGNGNANGNGNGNANGNGNENANGNANGNANENANGNANGNAGGANGGDATADDDDAVVDEEVDDEEDAEECDADADDEDDAGADVDEDAGDDANQDDADDADAGAGAGTGAGAADFGDCDPTLVREGGLNGRPADEFTFQSADAAIAANQAEALNPNIITNRICDELINICGANDAAIQACQDAQQAVEDAGLGAGSDGDEVLSTFNDLVLAA